MPTPSSTVKARNIAARPYASIIVDSYRGGLDAKGILGEGSVNLLEGRRSVTINRNIHQKYLGSLKLRQRRWREYLSGMT